MKLNLEIEIDWLDEEQGIDEAIQQQMINQVVQKIEQKVSKRLEDSVSATIDKSVLKKVDEMTTNLFNDFLKREVSINDNYGSIIKTYPSVTDVIKERFDNFMTEKVGKDGKPAGSYGDKYTRLVFIIDKQLKDFADKFTTDAVKQVSEEIKSHVKEGLTNKLGNELMEVLKVNEMIGLKSKN